MTTKKEREQWGRETPTPLPQPHLLDTTMEKLDSATSGGDFREENL